MLGRKATGPVVLENNTKQWGGRVAREKKNPKDSL